MEVGNRAWDERVWRAGESRMGRTEIIGDWDRRKKSEVLGNFSRVDMGGVWDWGIINGDKECGTSESRVERKGCWMRIFYVGLYCRS